MQRSHTQGPKRTSSSLRATVESERAALEARKAMARLLQ